MTIKLSKWFTLDEIEFSETAARYGIDNSLPSWLYTKARYSCSRLDAVRDLLKKPVFITSGFRCLRLNRLLKSKDTSQHLKMEAFDFVSPGFGTPQQVAAMLRDHADEVDFDQLILENTWIHISFVDPNEIPYRKPRREILTWYIGKPIAVGLWTKDGKEF